MSALVIGLGGRLRAGKDVVADHLVKKHGFKKIGMSDALHEAMMALDPVLSSMEDGTEIRYSHHVAAVGYVEAKKNREVRRLLQKLGTEVGRDMIDENVWVEIVVRRVRAHLSAGQSVAVTGIRFSNELTMIRQFPTGTSVWVERPDLVATAAAAHASENGVHGSQFDVTLLNDSSLEHLRRMTDQIVADREDRDA